MQVVVGIDRLSIGSYVRFQLARNHELKILFNVLCAGWFRYHIFVILNLNFYTVDYNKTYFTGPFGEQDDEQVFVQKVVPETDQLFVRLASNGKRYVLLLINLQLSFELWCAEEAG